MAYGDQFDFHPKHVHHSRYSDGTVLPSLHVNVIRNGEPYGYVELHLHRVKYPPHASVGVTSRVGPQDDSAYW